MPSRCRDSWRTSSAATNDSTVQSLGWSGIGNGALLQQAAEHGFEAFLTADRGFELQQNPQTLPLVVVILRASSNRLEDLRPLVPALLEKLAVHPEERLLSIASGGA